MRTRAVACCRAWHPCWSLLFSLSSRASFRCPAEPVLLACGQSAAVVARCTVACLEHRATTATLAAALAGDLSAITRLIAFRRCNRADVRNLAAAASTSASSEQVSRLCASFANARDLCACDPCDVRGIRSRSLLLLPFVPASVLVAIGTLVAERLLYALRRVLHPGWGGRELVGALGDG